MFKDCSNLNSVSVNFIEWYPPNAINGWLQNVSIEGTFYYKDGLPIQYGSSAIPNNWLPVKKESLASSLINNISINTSNND